MTLHQPIPRQEREVLADDGLSNAVVGEDKALVDAKDGPLQSRKHRADHDLHHPDPIPLMVNTGNAQDLFSTDPTQKTCAQLFKSSVPAT